MAKQNAVWRKINILSYISNISDNLFWNRSLKFVMNYMNFEMLNVEGDVPSAKFVQFYLWAFYVGTTRNWLTQRALLFCRRCCVSCWCPCPVTQTVSFQRILFLNFSNCELT